MRANFCAFLVLLSLISLSHGFSFFNLNPKPNSPKKLPQMPDPIEKLSVAMNAILDQHLDSDLITNEDINLKLDELLELSILAMAEYDRIRKVGMLLFCFYFSVILLSC